LLICVGTWRARANSASEKAGICDESSGDNEGSRGGENEFAREIVNGEKVDRAGCCD
jgi:hypothetical protein